ncbi:MAG: polysaccharide deacetylase family protein [Bacteroidales bacterium]|nr:polysaccharide deacetylase family protein [Bacteroidales bacterium]MCF8405638.1 polysaccharide deacetylase family protein [Bacteroidales bacterium]
MYLAHTPYIVKCFYPSLVWDISTNENIVFLTFDDGPDPEVTPQVLELLDKFKAKATFFCVGQKAEKHPEIVKNIISMGHSIGNHSYNHLKGKKTNNSFYKDNVDKADTILQTSLFRPPYGSIKPSQIKLLKKHFRIIMWSILPGDFDQDASKQKVLERSIKYTRKGSIIVFHDNNKFKDKMLFALEGFLSHFSKLNYKFDPIDADIL